MRSCARTDYGECSTDHEHQQWRNKDANHRRTLIGNLPVELRIHNHQLLRLFNLVRNGGQVG
jgi:hypothetical protein